MSKRILIVDDEPDVLEVMKMVLEVAGHEVVLATGGKEALDLLRNDADPSLILLDLMMPGMNGWQFMAEAQAVLDSIPVIVVSGGAFRKEEVLALGAVEYLTKPVELETLLSAVGKYS